VFPKNAKNCFCQNFVKSPPTLITCGTNLAKRIQLLPTSGRHNESIVSQRWHCRTIYRVNCQSNIFISASRVSDWSQYYVTWQRVHTAIKYNALLSQYNRMFKLHLLPCEVDLLYDTLHYMPLSKSTSCATTPRSSAVWT